jgi:hypothetical protein
MERYIGLDVHAASTTAAVIDARGKRVGPPHVLETNGKVLVEFIKLHRARSTSVSRRARRARGWRRSLGPTSPSWS